MFFSCEKAEEGIALVDLSGEDSRVQPQLRRHPKSSRPLVLFLREGGSKPFSYGFVNFSSCDYRQGSCGRGE